MGVYLRWGLLILPKPGFLRLAVYSAGTYEVSFYLTERNESIASFIINLMPWERIQQQTRQTRFSGAPIPSTVPDTQWALHKYSLHKHTNDAWAEGVTVTVVFLL